MNDEKNCNSPQGSGWIFAILCIFARKDIRNANANRMNLFSRAKSGKFSTGENKSTYPIHIIWRGLLLILAHRFTRACTIK